MSYAPAGPDPLLISRTQVEALYEILVRLKEVFSTRDVPWIVTGGSLLGAVRQHSILFTDDDIDIALLDKHETLDILQELLGGDFIYTKNAFGGRVRLRRASNVFVDVFCIRRYNNPFELLQVIGVKQNGEPQSKEYVQNLLGKIRRALGELIHYPIFQFHSRKAIELWPKEVYRPHELYPLCHTYKMGPVTTVSGPRMPITLLKRAFGDDCLDVYYQSNSHQVRGDTSSKLESTEKLPPRVFPGGLWEHSQPLPLQPCQYLPTQPKPRHKRRLTPHNLETLQQYLQQQQILEENCSRQAEDQTKKTVYMDGVFDLFHIGHLRAIQQCRALGDCVILGVTGDVDAAHYKRLPIMNQVERSALVKELVDDVVCPCPLVVTEDFMERHGIDLVVHGFADPQDAERQKEFFEIPMQLGRFQEISYHADLSTTDILERIRAQPETPKWFGTTLRTATAGSPTIPYDPFPIDLRTVIEPHIRKAATNRSNALSKLCLSKGIDVQQLNQTLARHCILAEYDHSYDTKLYPLRERLLDCCNFSDVADMSNLHQDSGAKDRLLRNLTENYQSFQELFVQFVLEVCAKKVDCDCIYFQAFPCLRIILPGEFSIGPHADVVYSHNPASINFYLPLTPIINGSESLFLESRPGSEDWHPILGDYGSIKQFAGAMCNHWTPENMTTSTRVSLDVRLIPGSLFEALKPPGCKLEKGYYCLATRNDSGDFVLQGDLPKSDARMGFPWTVSNWEKYCAKKACNR